MNKLDHHLTRLVCQATEDTENAYRASQAGEVCAYDYKRQRWVTGEAAVILRTEQLGEEIALLSGPTGEEYAAFLNIDRFRALDSLRKSLAEMEAVAKAFRAPEVEAEGFRYCAWNFGGNCDL